VPSSTVTSTVNAPIWEKRE